MDSSFFVSIRRDRQPGMVRLEVVDNGDVTLTALLTRPAPDSSPSPILGWADGLAVGASAVVQRLVTRFTEWPWQPLLLDMAEPGLRDLEWEDLPRSSRSTTSGSLGSSRIGR